MYKEKHSYEMTICTSSYVPSSKDKKKQNSLPGKNWNGEDAGRLDSLMASCSEVGGNKKGGKPSGIPGAREDKIFLFPAA